MAIKRKIETWEIIKDLVSSMNITINAGSDLWVDNGDGTYTLELCRTYWLETQESIDVNADIFTITDVVKDTSVTVSGSFMPVDNKFTLNAPSFYSGTIVQTNQELSQDVKDVSSRTPMAYLLRDIEDTFQPRDSQVERETSIRLFFLDDEDFNDFTTDKNSDEVLEPMRQMAYYFVEDILEKHPYIGKLDSAWSIRDYSKFGVENASGYTENIFNDTYSGVELSITLPIVRNYVCKC